MLEYSQALKEAIDYVLLGTGWRYYIRIPRDNTRGGRHKLEIHIKHHLVNGREKYAAMNTLCEKLLISDLPENLRNTNPGVAFNFYPSQEGASTTDDKVFAQYFCKTIVEKLCLGEDELAKKMEATKSSFMNRNSTKFLHQPMVGIYNAADIADRYSNIIYLLLWGIDMRHNGDKVRGDMKKAFMSKCAETLGAAATEGAQEVCPGLDKVIVIATQMIRAFVSFAPNIKKELKPLISKLNTAVTAARLAIARKAYIQCCEKPMEALNHLRSLENPTSEELALTVNTFGILMQSTLPLFNELYVVTDAEFATIATLSGVAGASVVAAAGGGIWWTMAAAGATTGPIGVVAVGGVFAFSFGVAAVVEGVKWGNKQDTNPSAVLIRIQKSLQECSLFILGLIALAAEKDKNSVYTDMLKDLKDQLKNKNYGKEGYSKGYYDNVSAKLEEDMGKLREGLKAYTVPTEV